MLDQVRQPVYPVQYEGINELSQANYSAKFCLNHISLTCIMTCTYTKFTYNHFIKFAVADYVLMSNNNSIFKFSIS